MRFCYRYQEKDGPVREGEVAATSVAEAYSVLRKSGVRPMKVWAKPGVFNAVSAIGKRGFAIVCLSLVVLALVFVVCFDKSQNRSSEGLQLDKMSVKPLPRQQCKKVYVPFRYETERFLANFVVPGDVSGLGAFVAVGGGISAKIVVVMPDFDEALKSPIVIEKGDSQDAARIKRIVVGLKDEARNLQLTGKKPSEVLDYFVARQLMEHSYREKVLQDLINQHEGSVTSEILESANKTLRLTGIRELAEDECRPNE